MRVFAYLKNTASAAAVLRGLEAEGCLTLAYVEGLGEAGRKKLASETLRVADRPVDVAAAAAARFSERYRTLDRRQQRRAVFEGADGLLRQATSGREVLVGAAVA